MKFKPIFRWDYNAKIFRVFRLLYNVGPVGFGGYSAKFSVSLSRRIFHFEREYFGWSITLFGLRIHYLRSYGGHFV